MSLIDSIHGVEAILEGFGRCPPPQEVAQARANVCMECPANFKGAWSISTAIASVIHAQRQKKLEMKLRVDGEDKLGTCTVCRCPLFLKVWYDFATIYGHTTDQMFDDLRKANRNCWQVKELEQHHTNPT